MKKFIDDEKNRILNNFIAYTILDNYGKIIDISNAYCNLTKFHKNEILDNRFIYFDNPQIQVKLQKDETFTGELEIFQKFGDKIYTYTIISPMFDDRRNKIGYMCIYKDIDDQKKLEELAVKDALTNLYNRRYFNKKLEAEIQYAKKMRKKLAFLMLDVDFFKKYNDSYGHQKGDDVLVNIAESMQETFMKKSDFIFRLGGEEFGILYRVRDKEEAIQQAEKLRIHIENKKIEHAQHFLKIVTVSIGLLVVDFDKEIVDSNGFYSMADTALYQAKENGRNQVVLYANATEDDDDLEFF